MDSFRLKSGVRFADLAKPGKQCIEGRVSIEDRPAYIHKRRQLGHWEGDLMLFAKYGQAVLVTHERRSRLLIVSRQPNLAALQRILEWNIAHDIELFRISSDVIPFGSHRINKVPWRTTLRAELEAIGRLVRAKGLRVSMHPGQFTVLNSPRPEVVASSMRELQYHAAFLDALAIDDTHKIVIHLGGVYDDKPRSLKRFMDNYASLHHRIRARLVIENDERCYTIADALGVAKAVGSPVVFDAFHHRWNPSIDTSSVREIIERSTATWRKRDGKTKIHYSNQWPGLPPGTHSRSISVKKFHAFYEQIKNLDVDVMLEVKDKERSVLKLMRSLPNLRSAAESKMSSALRLAQ